MQEWNRQSVGISEIARRLDNREDWKKYCDEDPMVLCQTVNKRSKRKRPHIHDKRMKKIND